MNAKTRARIHRITFRVKPYVSKSQLAMLTEIVEDELREQDRDTRHACAEAVVSPDLIQNNLFMPAAEVQRRAQAACINVQAI